MVFEAVYALTKRWYRPLPRSVIFGILARPKRFGGGVGAFLPHRARERRHKRRRYASLCQGREDVRREVVSIVRGSEHVGIGTQGMRTDSVRRMSWALGSGGSYLGTQAETEQAKP